MYVYYKLSLLLFMQLCTGVVEDVCVLQVSLHCAKISYDV